MVRHTNDLEHGGKFDVAPIGSIQSLSSVRATMPIRLQVK